MAIRLLNRCSWCARSHRTLSRRCYSLTICLGQCCSFAPYMAWPALCSPSFLQSPLLPGRAQMISSRGPMQALIAWYRATNLLSPFAFDIVFLLHGRLRRRMYCLLVERACKSHLVRQLLLVIDSLRADFLLTEEKMNFTRSLINEVALSVWSCAMLMQL